MYMFLGLHSNYHNAPAIGLCSVCTMAVLLYKRTLFEGYLRHAEC